MQPEVTSWRDAYLSLHVQPTTLTFNLSREKVEFAQSGNFNFDFACHEMASFSVVCVSWLNIVEYAAGSVPAPGQLGES